MHMYVYICMFKYCVNMLITNNRQIKNIAPRYIYQEYRNLILQTIIVDMHFLKKYFFYLYFNKVDLYYNSIFYRSSCILYYLINKLIRIYRGYR